MPYPAAMPGNKLYKISEAFDIVKGWWSFGNLAQFSYNLNIADKKLIEAKTLFEYKQYLLAANALPQYTLHLDLAQQALKKAKKEGKDISKKQILFLQAIDAHREILEQIQQETPENFLWQPEKQKPQTIKIRKLLKDAIESGRNIEMEETSV